jgi:hypothetical protein
MTEIKCFLLFEGFVHNLLLQNTDEYCEYKKNNLSFLENRNERIKKYNSKLN